MAKRDGQGALMLGAIVALFFLARQRGEAGITLPPAIMPPAVEVPELPGLAPPEEVPELPGYAPGPSILLPELPAPYTPPPALKMPLPAPYVPPGYVYVEGQGWVREEPLEPEVVLPPPVVLPGIPIPVIPTTGIETASVPTSSAAVEAYVAHELLRLEEAGY